MQNIYDNEEFHDGYMELRLKTPNANTVIEQPGLFSLLPDIKGKCILDLGCGTGESCIEYIQHGAKHVTGIEISEKMIKKAIQKGIKVILMTPSPDLKGNMFESGNELEKHANQIKDLANKYKVGLVDSYTSFQKIYSDCNCLKEYMSQSNHPNEKGHQVIVEEIIKLF